MAHDLGEIGKGVSPCSWVKVYIELVSLGRGHCFLARIEQIVLRVHASQLLIPGTPKKSYTLDYISTMGCAQRRRGIAQEVFSIMNLNQDNSRYRR